MMKLNLPARRGQSLVEFALVLPILLLLSVMVFDFGRVVYYSSALHNAAREGARYGIVHPNDVSGMKQTAIDYAIGLGLNFTDVDVDLPIPDPSQSYPPPQVTVTVTYDFYPATPLASNFMVDDYITLIGEAVMKLEALP